MYRTIKILKWAGIGIAGLLALCLIILAVMYFYWCGLSARPYDGPDGKPLANSVSIMEKIELGGLEQTIYIRGRDISKPVILFLDGGPGTPESMAVKHFNGDLEKDYIVANWDQRGAGKSFSPFLSKEQLAPANFVADAVELSEYLRKRFNKEKIYLVGHSWGTIIGVYTVRKRPDLFYAYIGIGQMVNLHDNERISYAFTLDQARKRGDVKAIKDLEEIKDYYEIAKWNYFDQIKQRGYLVKFGGVIYGRDSYDILYKIDLKDEHSLFDMVPFLLGSLKTVTDIWSDLFTTVKFDVTDTEFKIPMYFFTGSHDYNVPFELTEKYYKTIKAPKKGLVWFDKSAHMPNFEEPEKFMDELRKVFR